MTTPYFQVALNRDLTQDEMRQKKALRVLDTMISGEYDAEQAYQSFNTQLLEKESVSENIVLDSKKTYSNRFHTSGGNEAYSVMANTLRRIYGTDVLIATADSFTGNVLKAGYTEKMAGNMIMPNGLSAYKSKMSGTELKETIKNFVEGYEGGFIPFIHGSLPVVSGISVEIKETEDGYTLSKVIKKGKQIQDEDTFTVICLAIPKHMKTYPAEHEDPEKNYLEEIQVHEQQEWDSEYVHLKTEEKRWFHNIAICCEINGKKNIWILIQTDCYRGIDRYITT